MPESITEDDGIHNGWYEEAKQHTTKTLPVFIQHLTEDYRHDYGTICHAVAAAALAAAHAVDHAPCGGVTGKKLRGCWPSPHRPIQMLSLTGSRLPPAPCHSATR